MNRDDIDYLQNTNWFATSGAGLSSRGRRMIKVEFYQVQNSKYSEDLRHSRRIDSDKT